MLAQEPPTRSRTARGEAAGRWEEAATLDAELLVARPDGARLHMNLGTARAMPGQPDAALSPLHRTVDLDPSLLPAQLFLGTVYLDVGEPRRALAPLEQVIAAEAGNVPPLFRNTLLA